MHLVRIANTAFIDQINGEGARICGGRWNKVGDAVVYLAEDISLAILETVVHANPRRKLDRSLLVLNVPDASSIETLVDLPDGWEGYPHIDGTAEIGSKWIVECRTLLLRVPSAITAGVSEDLWKYNVLMNPKHPEFANVKIERIERWRPDSRLL
jgi:RES domain-containing protein